MEVPYWVFDPFTNPVDAEMYLQEELINLQSNEELKPRLKHGYDLFWLQKLIPISYPGLWTVRRYRSLNEEAQPLANSQTRRPAASCVVN
uniref:Uncharacterized protein n=1 Tax=Trichuris muris TaxID=70415 RepID=A0A5S6QAV0_TRIMR